MFRIALLTISAFCLLVSSCQEQRKRAQVKDKQESGKPFIFRMNQFFSSAENEVNFPLWFEDSIVAGNKIATIIRSTFLVTGDSEEETDLREVRSYFFNRKGKLDSMTIVYFFDDHMIGDIRFHWEADCDPMGYRKLLNTVRRNELIDDAFILYEPLESGVNSFCYQSGTSKKCFIPRRDFWGPFSVDTILRPNPEDQIILGKAKIPFKKYNVSNKVHERNVQLYTYFDDGRAVRTITRSEYPFEIKRSVIFDKEWRCMGYVDSTFSEEVFLTATRARITTNKSGLPVKLKKIKGGNKAAFSVVSREEYEYIFYEK
jgi:hypothetical protein